MKKIFLGILVLFFLAGFSIPVSALELNFQEKIQPSFSKAVFGWLDILKKYSSPTTQKTNSSTKNTAKETLANENAGLKKTKYTISSKKQTGKQFSGCELWSEYSSYRIPNFSVKIYNQTTKKTEFEAFFGKVFKDPLNCTLFYEKTEDYCDLKCITTPKDLVLDPPIPYTTEIPENFLEKLLQKYSLKPDWPESFPALKVKDTQTMRRIND